MLLLLFKPWRQIVQLKKEGESWVSALSTFEDECSKEIIYTTLKVVGTHGNIERLQYILNVDTLSKSWQDSEEESKA